MDAAAIPWWVWPIALFAVTFVLGIVAVLAGVGGGVLFVPIVGSFFPFHLDFVRGVGLLFALSGTLAAGPVLLRTGMANLRLVMPLALAGSIASLAGAVVGLSVATDLLRLRGEFEDPAAGMRIDWRTRRTAAGVAAFAAIGFFGGVFGLGAGFANVPALNLLMAAPMKVAVGSSGLIISIIN